MRTSFRNKGSVIGCKRKDEKGCDLLISNTHQVEMLQVRICNGKVSIKSKSERYIRVGYSNKMLSYPDLRKTIW